MRGFYITLLNVTVEFACISKKVKTSVKASKEIDFRWDLHSMYSSLGLLVVHSIEQKWSDLTPYRSNLTL